MTPGSSIVRGAASVVVATLVAAYGAIVLGEYELAGITPLYAGALFGLVIGEVVVFVGRDKGSAAASAAGFIAYAGMLWAVVLSTAKDLDYAEATAWIGVLVAPAVATLWVRTSVRRGGRSPRGS